MKEKRGCRRFWKYGPAGRKAGLAGKNRKSKNETGEPGGTERRDGYLKPEEIR